MVSRKRKSGSLFSDYLRGEGCYAEISAVAVKRVLAWQLEEPMRNEARTKDQRVKRMKNSRS